MFLLMFVCLFVCLSVSTITRHNVCMDLDEMLRVDRCWDMGDLINFEPDPDYNPDARTRCYDTAPSL